MPASSTHWRRCMFLTEAPSGWGWGHRSAFRWDRPSAPRPHSPAVGVPGSPPSSAAPLPNTLFSFPQIILETLWKKRLCLREQSAGCGEPQGRGRPELAPKAAGRALAQDGNHGPDNTLKKEHLDIINRKISQLPKAERNLLEHGWTECCPLWPTSKQSFPARLKCDTGSYRCWFTDGSDPIFDSRRSLQVL